MAEDHFKVLPKTDRMILSLLQQCGWEEIYGREFVERSGGRLSKGSIYVLLHRMEHDKGFLESRRAADGTYKRLYWATGSGQVALAMTERWEEFLAQNPVTLPNQPLPDGA